MNGKVRDALRRHIFGLMNNKDVEGLATLAFKLSDELSERRLGELIFPATATEPVYGNSAVIPDTFTEPYTGDWTGAVREGEEPVYCSSCVVDPDIPLNDEEDTPPGVIPENFQNAMANLIKRTTVDTKED